MGIRLGILGIFGVRLLGKKRAVYRGIHQQNKESSPIFADEDSPSSRPSGGEM
jgi:hypothetical protein